MCNDAEKKIIQSYCDRTVAQIQQGDMASAFNIWDEMLNGDIYPYANYFHKCAHYHLAVPVTLIASFFFLLQHNWL